MQQFMTAWNEEKLSEDYKKRVQISVQSTLERRFLKRAAHTARQNLVQAAKSNCAIRSGRQDLRNLSRTERRLLDDYNSGELARIRDACDAAVGWNKQKRIAVGSAAARVGQ